MKKITYIIIGLGSPREEKEEKKFINALNSDNKKYNKSKRKLPFLPFLSDNKKNINLAFSKYKERFSPYEEI
jgi:hypothetical protein